MAKIIIEFNEEDANFLNFYANRHKILSALDNIVNLRRNIYKGYVDQNKLISIKDNKVVTEEEFKEATTKGEMVTGTVSYIDREWIEDELWKIIEDINFLLY